ncbi:hypothetical protein KC19_11G020400 [Ceratodon purpureus]|uniref:F-box domain-containing protein n=1 Tax=Ceratodon purpureus TaxID=3225 RepID=A0A8T0GBE6_CERPU|nr:hypothetical protein KC19_11G020400 [Ceratodon purpureus]
MAKKGYTDVLCRVNQVLHKLEDCSAELKEIERIVTVLKTDSSSELIDERPDLLLVTETVRDMLNVLETGLEGISGKQRMQVAIQEMNSTEDRASEDDNTRSKRNRLSTQAEPSNGCGSSSKETRVTKTATWNDPKMCKHTWSKLTEDLVVQVFARLPIPRIIGLRKCSEAWSAMSDSSSFKGVFAEANPKLFGFLGWDGDLDKFRARIVDVTSKECHGIELDFPKGNGYMDSLFACDGGLVCFVPVWEGDFCFKSAFVCNPLTNHWKKLPDIPFGFQRIVLLQLVTDSDVICFRVIVVYSEKLKSEDTGQTFGAFMFDSKSGSWSTMDSGLVYGNRNTLSGGRTEFLLFDCATKKLIVPEYCPSLRYLPALCYSNMRDRVFVLHVLVNPDSPSDSTDMLVISEYTWDSITSDVRKVNDYEVTLKGLDFRSYANQRDLEHEVEIFTSSGFILSTWDKVTENGRVRQLTSVYDISIGQWRDLPPSIEGVFMCELRWDAIP